jgi:hypothetical protein
MQDHQGRPAIFQLFDHHAFGAGAAQGLDGIVEVT